ncbi:hypothetical protein [Pseudomonas sp. AG1028]|uniref:hypothetical protein n=1 Tax=Pseudomonas sp. AG1028 TaxID=2572911 RepID=UPI0011BF3526|nr:hypothetical protein [Pseudomonas sp. AG1028]
MTDLELVAALKALPDEDLALVLGMVLPERNPFAKEPEVVISRMFLGIYTEYTDERSISIIAYPKDGEQGPYWGFCQSADSPISGISFVSSKKEAISPLNGTTISLT